MITLGRRSFSGPFLSPLWLPTKGAGVLAVLVPGWRLLTFRALHFACAEDFAAPGLLKSHPRYAEWVRIAGTDWNLYVGTCEMSFSTQAQRDAAQRELEREYRPDFHAPVASVETPSLKTMLLAQAMRMNRPE